MQVGQTLTIGGWVKTGREAGGGKWIFLEVNDGTSFQSLQVKPSSIHQQEFSLQQPAMFRGISRYSQAQTIEP